MRSLLLLIALSLPLVAEPAALDSDQKAAEAANPEANYRRALILLKSEKESERKQGVEVLESAAKDDPGNAGRILGEAYLRGLTGEEADFENAARWWSRASEAGDTASILLLSRLYHGEFGFADQRDPAKSLELLRKAAKLGETSAYVGLASRLLNAEEELRNEKEGREWLEKAIAEKLMLAYLVLGDFEENVKEDPKAAYSAYLTGAEAGQTDCMLRVANLCLQGKGVEKDEAKAIEWIDKAAKAGNPSAAYEMASRLSRAEKPDPLKFYPYLLAAANGDLPAAQNELGLLYVSGNLGAADATAAVAWLTRAAKNGLADAQSNLGAFYERGVGVPVNYSSAGELYSLAANQGHAAATSALARMTSQGIGTKKDIVKGWALATLAVERGDEAAKAILGELSSELTPGLLIAAKKVLEELKKPAAAKAEAGDSEEKPAEK